MFAILKNFSQYCIVIRRSLMFSVMVVSNFCFIVKQFLYIIGLHWVALGFLAVAPLFCVFRWSCGNGCQTFICILLPQVLTNLVETAWLQNRFPPSTPLLLGASFSFRIQRPSWLTQRITRRKIRSSIPCGVLFLLSSFSSPGVHLAFREMTTKEFTWGLKCVRRVDMKTLTSQSSRMSNKDGIPLIQPPPYR